MICTGPFNHQRLGSSLIQFFCLYTTIRPEIRVLINLFLFVHNHSTKVRSHSYSLIYSFLNCADISFAIFKAVLIPLYFVHFVSGSIVSLYFVCYIHSSTTLMFPTLYSWKYCSYISYAISMATWSLGHLVVEAWCILKIILLF